MSLRTGRLLPPLRAAAADSYFMQARRSAVVLGPKRPVVAAYADREILIRDGEGAEIALAQPGRSALRWV